MLVEIVGRTIRCGDDNYAAVVEGAKETMENGGIGDVVDLKLVEAEQPGVGSEGVGERRNGIEGGVGGGARTMAPTMNAAMDVEHEGVKVGATFERDVRAVVEEEVHAEGFASANTAIKVKTFWRRNRRRNRRLFR
jgi:hypothetical protein